MELINGRTAEEIKKTMRICGIGMCDIRNCPHADCRDCSDRAMHDALALIERLEAAQPRWISVKDRLPEKGDNVLISLCGCNVKQAVYRGDGVFEAAYADTYHSTDLGSIVLTHWMPTPKPMEVSE